MNKRTSILITSEDGVLMFSSVESAEKYVEPIDVLNGTYQEIIGSNGESYRFSVHKNKVYIIPDKSKKNDIEYFRTILISSLSSRGHNVSEIHSLEDLLDISSVYLDD